MNFFLFFRCRISIYAKVEKLILLFSNLLGHNFALNVFQTHSSMKVGLKRQLINDQKLTFYWFLGWIDRSSLSEYQMRMRQVVGTPKVNQFCNKDKSQIKVLQESRGWNTCEYLCQPSLTTSKNFFPTRNFPNFDSCLHYPSTINRIEIFHGVLPVHWTVSFRNP